LQIVIERITRPTGQSNSSEQLDSQPTVAEVAIIWT